MSSAMWAALPLLCAGAWLLSVGATEKLTVNAIGTWRKWGAGLWEHRRRNGDLQSNLGGPKFYVIQQAGKCPGSLWSRPRYRNPQPLLPVAFSREHRTSLPRHGERDGPACTTSFCGLGPRGSPCLGSLFDCDTLRVTTYPEEHPWPMAVLPVWCVVYQEKLAQKSSLNSWQREQKTT